MKTAAATIENATPAEAAAITTAERKLKRGVERRAESETMLSRAQDDADILGVRVPPDELEQRREMVKEDGFLIAKLESELDAAKAAPALRVTRDRLARDLQMQAVAIVNEIDSAVATLEKALAKADQVADAIGRGFLDPAFGYRILMSPFRGSPVLSLLRFWRQDVSKQRLAIYRSESARLDRRAS